MNGWWPLFKKEVLEQVRTNRVLILAGVFLFFGLTTPLTLKYLPDIIKMLGESMQIVIPPPKAVESLAEFASTIAQIGTVVVMLSAMGSIANEYKYGTVLLTLSKPVSRFSFVSAKMAAAGLNVFITLLVSSLVCFGYSVWLIGPADLGAFLVQTLLLLLFLLFCLSVTLLFSGVFKNGLAAFAVAGITVVVIAIVSTFPVIGNYLPGKLPGWGLGIVNGANQSYWWALGITLGLTGLCLYLAQLVLKKKEG